MNITSAQYQVDVEGSTSVSMKATIDGQIMHVPLDPDNRHYQAIQKWLKIEGNTIEEAE